MAASDPATTTVPMIASGSRIILAVSQGAEKARGATAEVPDVAGAMQGKALTKLQEAGFQARVINDYSETYVRGKVMGQVPAAGTSAVTSTQVALLVSSGAPVTPPPQVRLPDVVGMTEAEATEKLKQAELSAQVVGMPSAAVPIGVVMGQMPDAAWLTAHPAKKQKWWLWALIGVAVLAVALAFMFTRGADEAVTAEVPDVVGMTLEQATTSIEDAGFALGDVEEQASADVAEGDVISQSPESGTQADEGSAIDLVVSAGEELVAVPDVTGLTETDARAELEKVGLRASTRTEERSDVEAGTVVAQEPAVGTEVAPGEVVDIAVAIAAAPESSAIPSVVGLTFEDARKTLETAGFKVQSAETPSTTVAKDVVIAQMPASGTSLPPGASVALLVSSGAPLEPENVQVPNVVGEELADAEEALSKLGLGAEAVTVEGTAENSGDVLAQVPEADEFVPVGSTILLLYAE
jgi:beta-lactam-binding protein with PASTA domain